MKYVYDEKKYCVSNFLNDDNLLSRQVWHSLSAKPGEGKDLKVEKIKEHTVVCSYFVYDRASQDFVEIMEEYPMEDIALAGDMAVALEFNKILSSLDAETAEFLEDLVSYKERSAAIAGYNGCI